MKSPQRWSVVFKALGNVNRLKIIAMLSATRRMTVADIAETLEISITATSNNLVLLQKLEVLRSEGKDGHVFYSLNPDAPRDFAKSLKLFD